MQQAAVEPDGGLAAPSRAEAQYRRFRRQSYFESAIFFTMLPVVRIIEWREHGDGRPLWLYVWPLAVLVVAHFLLSVPALRPEHRRRGLVYLGMLPPAAVALAWVHLDFTVPMLMIAVAVEAFFLIENRIHALCTVLALAGLTLGATYLLHGPAHEYWDTLLINFGVNLAVGTAIALWVTTDLRGNLANAVLVDELRAAQGQLAAAKHAEGVDAERQRVAREIHDTLAQGYTTILMQTQAADRALDTGDLDLVRQRHAVVADVARANLAEARSLVAAFAPAPLQEASLPEALSRLARRWSAEAAIPCEARLDEVGPLSADQDVVLLRVAQEALTNVAKHSGATRAWLRLGGRRDLAVRLVVEDNGSGIPAGAVEGYGLAGMRARVAEVGGTLTVVARPEGGTIVRVTLTPPARPQQMEEQR